MSALSETAPTSARIQPDNPILVRGVVAATVLLAAASWAAGVPGLLAVAGWAQLEGPLRWTVPVILDGGLLIYGAVATVQRARHESARFAWAVLGFLTVASVAGQVAHVIATSDRPMWQVYSGAALAATFPILVFASTHSVLAVSVAPAPARRTRAAVAAPARRRPIAVDVATNVVAPVADRPALPVRQPATRAAVTRGGVSEDVRAQILELAAAGHSQRAIAATVASSKSAVSRIVTAAAQQQEVVAV